MIPEARAVRLSRKERDVLEARCRSPVTIQRDLKRARIVLLAAAGRSTRSIAKEVGVEPRIVSHWRRRFADDGLGHVAELGFQHRIRHRAFERADRVLDEDVLALPVLHHGHDIGRGLVDRVVDGGDHLPAQRNHVPNVRGVPFIERQRDHARLSRVEHDVGAVALVGVR